MSETNPTLTALFTDIADAIREKIGGIATIVADDFPDVIRERLQAAPPPATSAYLTFSSPSSFTLKVNDATKHWDGTLEYSTNTSTWSTWDGTSTLSSATNRSDNVLYLRGTGNTKITGNSTDYRWVITGTDISCIGNIENLLDYATVQSGAHPTMTDYCYYRMFDDCTSLTQAPALPATMLAGDCYSGMFASCTALTQAPALPATTLANDCYFSMFRDCTSLIQAPALPATTLVTNCYSQMFYGCTGLIQAPALPATTLADSCYKFMFRGCTSLTQAPALPATTLASDCYKNMFSGCTALTQAPALPATMLTSNCYNQMFYGCTGLIQAPALPATTLAIGCYWGMFNRCTNLTQAPALPATTLAPSCYRFMFEFTAITTIPRIMATTYATDSCKGMFDDIKTLNVYSSSGPGHTYGWTAPASTYCSGMFGSDDGESEWAKLDGSNFPNSGTPTEGVTYYFAVNSSYLTFSSPSSFTLKVNDTTKHWNGTLEYSTDTSTWATWDGTTTLSSATSGSDNVLYLRGTGNTVITGNASNYKWVLTGSDIACIGNIEYLLDYATVQSGAHPTMTDNCYSGMFSGCTSLTQAPALPATTLTTYCYESMFFGCTSLTQAPALPATTLAPYCYCQMFHSCTGLTQAPALPATTLAFSCYFAMFRSCTSLKLSTTQTGEYTVSYRIPTTGTGTMITSALTEMFASTGGTFTGTPEINKTYYLSNTNTIV